MPDHPKLQSRILIADDHELARRGLRVTLEEVPTWTIVAEAGNGWEALAAVRRHRPHVAVLDLGMPELNGLGVARSITAERLPTRVLLMTTHPSEQLVHDVLHAGAQGYILKSDSTRVLLTAVAALIGGGTFVTPADASWVSGGDLQTLARGRASSSPLSARERQIMQLLAEGRTTKAIACALDISIKTAETHRSRVMSKMGFGSLPELVRYAVRNQIIEP